MIYNAHILYIHFHLERGFKNIWQQSCKYCLRLIPQEKLTHLYVPELVSNGSQIKIPAKGYEFPIYHPRCIGEKNLLPNYTMKRHLTDHWKHKLELLNTKRKQLTAIGKT